MLSATYFARECPTCGRQLRIRIEYLGKRVVCQHCQGQFDAVDPSNLHRGLCEDGHPLLRRAEELLESTTQLSSEIRLSNPR